MPLTLRELPINPFESSIVMEPREAELAIEPLNGGSLQTLLKSFERLESQPVPRLERLDPPLLARLVISTDPGYGKSHLLGRLFRSLARRATRIYLRPFQDPDSSWRSILQKVTAELNRPEDPSQVANRSGSPTQLDAVAHGVFAHLLAGLIESKQVDCENPDLRARELRADSMAAFGAGAQDHSLANWLRDRFRTELMQLFLDEFLARNIRLTARPSAWLKVLFSYAYGTPHQRGACLEWIQGEGLSEDESTALGLTPNELPDFVETPLARNEVSEHRLLDLLKLSSFYRPFIFSFDQTENLTGNPDAAAEFGRVITELVENGCNLFLVTTANSDPWQKICAHIEKAHLDRYSKPPLSLEGINQEQASLLIHSRLSRHDVAENEIEQMCQGDWIAGCFRDRPSMSVRNFLQACAQHFNELIERGPLLIETLEDHFQRALNEAGSKPGFLDFDLGVLSWFISPQCAGAIPDGWEVRAHEDWNPHQYFRSFWQRDHDVIFWGVEDSNNWKRWSSFVQKAKELRKRAYAKGHSLRAKLLRLHDQKPIPGPKWAKSGDEIRAESEWFHIRILTREDWETIVAAHTLWSNAQAGDIPFTPEEVLKFLHQRLLPVWETLLSDHKVVVPGLPVPDTEKIREIISRKRFLSLDQLLGELQSAGAEVLDRRGVLEACKEMVEVSIFTTAQTTALQWNLSS